MQRYQIRGERSHFYRYIEYIMAIGLKTVWTLRIAPRHQSVYVNNVVNSNIDSTVHVNNTIFPFMLLLRF